MENGYTKHKRKIIPAPGWLVVFTVWMAFLACRNSIKDEPSFTGREIPVPENVSDTLGVMFYNVENLFDTIDDPRHNDNDFLPAGAFLWDGVKYKQKIRNLARVIERFARRHEAPVIVGLAEVENDRVLRDLTGEGLLRPYQYRFIHYESPDFRGIDVALLYRPPFKVFYRKPVKVYYDAGRRRRRLRDILVVGGRVRGDTLFVLVNHWPSQRKGSRRSEPEREAAARALARTADALRNKFGRVKILIMGDFNENPDGKAVQNILHPHRKRTDARGWYAPLTHQWNPRRTGSARFHGRWNLFDQIFVNRSLLALDSTDRGGQWLLLKAGIFRDRILLQGRGIHRSFHGTEFDPEGFSDHLPVYVLLGYVENRDKDGK